MKFDTEIISVTEAAKFCKVTRSTIWRWIKSGLLNAGVTAGGHYRISREDLHNLIQSKGMTSCRRTKIKQHKIFIVDDDPSIRRLLSMTLMKNGFEVDSASNGFEAGIKIMKFQPHIVILDLYMPGMDGFEVCRQIRKNRELAAIKVIAISGCGDSDNREKILNCGADYFFPKPMDSKVMIRAIHNLITSEEM